MPGIASAAPPAAAAPPAEPVSLETAACRAHYVRNMAALYRVQPGVAAQLEAADFAACPMLEPTRDGRFTAQIAGDEGRPVYLHSRHRPREEAARLIGAQRQAPPENREATAPEDVRTFFLSGIGLGYHVLELQQQVDEVRVIVAENNLGLIKSALALHDFEPLLKEARLLWITSADKSHFHETLRPVNADILLGLKYIALPYTQRYHNSFHSEIRRLLGDFMSFARVQILTLVRNARITAKNLAFNLPVYASRPGVEVLQHRARGYPAILIAAGPSLARNIDQLHALQDRAILIAVQTVFKTLLARGIRPHFVTSLDYHEISAQFFHDVNPSAETILVAEPKAAWQVFDAFPGRTHLLHNEWYDDLMRASAPRRGVIKAGSTVAHLSFYLAEYLGCDPIILVGQDLSFCEGLYYPPGMPIERVWQPELHRFYTIEMKQWERIIRARNTLRPVKDIHGRAAYTDEQMFTYAEQFQSDFAASPVRVIHAVEGGIPLSGTQITTLREAAEHYCTRSLPPGLLSGEGEGVLPKLREQAAESLRARLREVEELQRIGRATLKILERLTGLLDRPAEFNRELARVDDLRAAITKHDRTYKMVVGVSQLAELRRYSADRRIGSKGQETTETARRRLRRDITFVRDFLDGCAYLTELLPQTLERLRSRT